MKYFLIAFFFTGLYAWAELPNSISDKKIDDNFEYLDQKVSNMSFVPKSKAQLNTIVPNRVGLAYYCSDCSPKKVVISTGTAKANWANIDGGAFQ